MIHSAQKPIGTFYSDFTISKGYVYAIFEFGGRVIHKKLGKTNLTNETWVIRDENNRIKGFRGEVKETETHLIIETFE